MTYTTQSLSRTTIENAEGIGKTEEEKNIYDILSVCDSLNRLCEILSRLEYAIRRKNIEISLKKTDAV